ncbi:hypothetical protein [Mucilaginibacter aquatilis]|uniref:Uncharacterized protein n=1 Tax=Mucilaginibacter aquatilis TaxID=1517760 RepID=A0A6I4ID22_9SPHI|nr:hypothetical protein [Mucilaginibacter aquatilis]MVN93062.1 hypothetical protein [Mucilaginibacter aquatilis]
MEIDIEHKDLPEDNSWRQKLPQPGNAFDVPAGYFNDLSERIISGVHLEQFKQSDISGGFTIPENYFTALGDNIVSRIAIEETLTGTTNAFAVPANYFDELAVNIQSRITIEEATDASQEAFTVPQGYFEKLNSNIQSRLVIEEAFAGENEGFEVPQGYFENLSDSILSRIALEEATEPQHNAFEVPAGYFDTLQQSIISQTTGESEAKVIQMPSRPVGVVRKLVSTAAFKYASAACFAIIAGAALYFSDAPLLKSHGQSYLHQELSEIPSDDIRNFLETQTEATETEHRVIADGTQIDSNALRAAIQDYVDLQ